MNFKNRPVRTGDLKGVLNNPPPPPPLIGVARSLPLIGLRQLSQDCQFGSFLDEMIRDRLVCGINSEMIQSRLLSEPELSLQKATEMAVALETAGRNQQELSGAASSAAQPPEPAVQAQAQQTVHQRATAL